MNDELVSELVSCLKYWAEIGVSGFRCDVASNLPVDFWMKAKRQVATVNPKVVWLAETGSARIVERR
jgi:glycosidase